MTETPSPDADDEDLYPKVDRRGAGHPGYCKICAWPKVNDLNAQVRRGRTAVEVQRWSKKYHFDFNRQTLYTHRNKHMTSRADKLVQAAERIPERDKIRESSDEEVLRGIRDLGYAAAIADPSTVNVNHALKAISVLNAAKPQNQNVLILLAKAMTTSFDEIEGQYENYEYPLLTEGSPA